MTFTWFAEDSPLTLDKQMNKTSTLHNSAIASYPENCKLKIHSLQQRFLVHLNVW
jgi:hypothetical protein